MEVGSSRTVRYGEDFGHCDFKLLEVDEGMLQELIHSGYYPSLLSDMTCSDHPRLSIKGGVDDEAVLCTSSKTYALKFVSTSNTALLIPFTKPVDAKNGVDDVIATCGGHMELVEVAPRLDRLKELVNRRPYTEDSESEQLNGLCSWNDLLDNVQASEEQLREGLKALAATEIGGYWRTVDPKYMQCLLEVIILTAIQKDWSLSALPLEELMAVLEGDGYSAQLVRHCLATYGVETFGPSLWALDEREVCLHYAKQLLSTSPRWKVDEFVHAWQQALPSGMKGNLEMLRGEVIFNKLGSDSWLHQFSVSALSTKPAERFATLFRERPRWDWQDLEPYLRDMRVPGQSVEAMLLKYTRKTQPTAESQPIYTPR